MPGRSGNHVGFGAPKPLPGQNGAGMSESRKLESEASDMERRLLMLQERMKAQAEEDEKIPRRGGSRWGSARTDRGSVTTYNRDLQEKHKKRSSDPGYTESVAALKATANGRREARKKQSESCSLSGTMTGSSSGSNTDAGRPVESWSVAEVCSWLDSLGFSQYKTVFQENEITGAILLELSLEDFDYMNIKALGHRKVLLKNIELLRRKKGPDALGTTSARSKSSEGRSRIPNSSRVSQSMEDIGSAAVGESRQIGDVGEGSGPKKHWSQLKPISSNVVSGGEMSINASDGQTLDEAAEQRAFMDAVMEWRRGSSLVADAHDDKTFLQPSGKENTDDGMWHAPWAEPPEEKKDEEKTRMMCLADADLDEEAERKAFAAAVEAWRNGKSSSTDTNREQSSPAGPSSAAPSSSGTGMDSATDMEPLSNKGGRDKVDALTAMLQAQHAEDTRRIAQRRVEAEAKLELAKDAAKEAESLKIEEMRNLEEKNALMVDDEGDSFSPSGDKFRKNHGGRSEAKATGFRRAEVKLVESTMGIQQDEAEGSYYVMEEDSD